MEVPVFCERLAALFVCAGVILPACSKGEDSPAQKDDTGHPVGGGSADGGAPSSNPDDVPIDRLGEIMQSLEADSETRNELCAQARACYPQAQSGLAEGQCQVGNWVISSYAPDDLRACIEAMSQEDQERVNAIAECDASRWGNILECIADCPADQEGCLPEATATCGSLPLADVESYPECQR